MTTAERDDRYPSTDAPAPATGRRLPAAASSTRKPGGARKRKSRVLDFMLHVRRVHVLSKALAKALEDSRLASSWPGERLPVSFHIAEQVEQATRRLQLELEAHTTPPSRESVTTVRGSDRSRRDSRNHWHDRKAPSDPRELRARARRYSTRADRRRG